MQRKLVKRRKEWAQQKTEEREEQEYLREHEGKMVEWVDVFKSKKDNFNSALSRQPLVSLCKILYSNSKAYFMTYWTNTRHVCTYLNAFPMVISNILVKFHNFDSFGSLGSVLLQLCELFFLKERNSIDYFVAWYFKHTWWVWSGSEWKWDFKAALFMKAARCFIYFFLHHISLILVSIIIIIRVLASSYAWRGRPAFLLAKKKRDKKYFFF